MIAKDLFIELILKSVIITCLIFVIFIGILKVKYPECISGFLHFIEVSFLQ